MKRRRLLLLLAGCVVLITLTYILWPHRPEPEYNGIPLSKWLEQAYSSGNLASFSVYEKVKWSWRWRTQLTPTGFFDDDEFAKAIKNLGTNSLPTLVQAVDYQLPGWKVWLYSKAFPKLPRIIVHSRLVLWLMNEKRERRANAAVIAFGLLGARAAPALDDLRRIACKYPVGYASESITNMSSPLSGDPDRKPLNLN